MTTKDASNKWGLSDRRIRVLCSEHKIKGAIKSGKTWIIPDEAKKPSDSRYKLPKSINEQIIELKKVLDSKRPLSQSELTRLNNEFIVEYTYNSNAIEGNTLTLRETDLVLQGITIDKKPLRDHLEVIGHKEAFEYVCELVKNKSKLDEKYIKQIHFLVLNSNNQDRGVYRKIPVRIMGSNHIPPQPYLIESKMHELLVWYSNSTDELIFKIAKFHI